MNNRKSAALKITALNETSNSYIVEKHFDGQKFLIDLTIHSFDFPHAATKCRHIDFQASGSFQSVAQFALHRQQIVVQLHVDLGYGMSKSGHFCRIRSCQIQICCNSISYFTTVVVIWYGKCKMMY